MRRFPELRPNGWDALVLAAVLMLTLGSALYVFGGNRNSDGLTVVISVDGAERERVELARLTGEEERTISAGGYTLYLIVSSDGAEVRESDCPTQDCVHTGKITRPGQSIVCLPARVSVQLVGVQADDGVDAVIG